MKHDNQWIKEQINEKRFYCAEWTDRDDLVHAESVIKLADVLLILDLQGQELREKYNKLASRYATNTWLEPHDYGVFKMIKEILGAEASS